MSRCRFIRIAFPVVAFQRVAIHRVWSTSVSILFLWMAFAPKANADWQTVYEQNFESLKPGIKTSFNGLKEWNGGSASGTVFDGKTSEAGKFLIATSSWRSFNQGPILNLNLAAHPHDKVKVRFKLYAFGDWRGLQAKTGGPQHRLMFFDTKAVPRFAFDTNFSTNKEFNQSWPKRNPASHPALSGSKKVQVDATGRFKPSHCWEIEFEYPTSSNEFRFAILCGAAAGSGKGMPDFGIDDIEVLVHSTAPSIRPVDRPNEIKLATKNKVTTAAAPIRFELKKASKISVGVFDSTGRLVRTLLSGEQRAAGQHQLKWDGHDNRGNPVPSGDYSWRLVSTPGFVANYITTLGINPPGGESPTPRRSWVGDHVGGGIVDVDKSGIYVGSPMTEGLMMLAKIKSNKSGISWRREQFYQSGRLTKVAANGQFVFMLHPNGKLRRLNGETGKVEEVWQIAEDKKAPIDIDAQQKNLVVAEPTENQIRWLSTKDGKTVGTCSLNTPSSVAAKDTGVTGQAFASAGKDIFVVRPNASPQKVASLTGTIQAMDYAPIQQELWVVVDGCRVVCLDSKFKIKKTFGKSHRPFGKFDPTQFAGIYDIASDLNGGFLVGEPSHPPRRIVHFDKDGKLLTQWFGGMSFYTGGVFDPQDPTRCYGIAPEGFINVYKIDYEKKSWAIEACYSTGRLGDSLFPMSGAYRIRHRGGKTFLYHRVVPSVIRLDSTTGKAIPVAIAGRVLNKGRTFFQFGGSGRDGYPKPWVAAAEKAGYRDLGKAPKLFSWADTNGNGEIEPSEFRFYPDAKRGVSFHNPGDFNSKGDFIGSTHVNESDAIVRLPIERWEGPDQTAPRWNWNKVQTSGKIAANSYGYGSPRGLSVDRMDSVSIAYQAGIMIRSHGQYEGGGWPEAALRGARVLGYDSDFRPLFEVGRQSKDASEINSGVLYYPMQTGVGPNRSIVVNDQTKQPAQVWTHDGLYVGGFFDGRVNDGLDKGFYQIHGDDNQGATTVTTKSGKTYWLSPYQGHNRLYEIRGWKNWRRLEGKLTAPSTKKSMAGKGLRAVYFQGNKRVHQTIEDPIYFERFGGERHAGKVTPHYKVVWTGFLVPPLSDRFQFSTVLGKNEQVAVWVDGKLLYAKGFSQEKNANRSIELTRGRRHQFRIEYINPDGRSELNLLWSSRILDPSRIPVSALHPN